MSDRRGPSTTAKDAVITVGDGRGFLLGRASWSPRVITAAHCLPHLPPAYPTSVTHQRSYLNLLGPLGEEGSVPAECVFVDPIGDLAVLEAPDGQALPEAEEAYERFVAGRSTLRIEVFRRRDRAWVLTLEGEWAKCTVDASGRDGSALQIIGRPIEGGMSGSPIVSDRGGAIGLLSMAMEAHGVPYHEQHGQPALLGCLPGWLLGDFLQSPKQFLESIMASKRSWDRLRRRHLKGTAGTAWLAAIDHSVKE